MECDEEHSAMEHRRNNFQVFQHLCCVFVFKSSEKLPIVGSLSWWQPDNMINGNGNSSTGNCSKFMLWLCSLLLLLLLLIEGRKRDFNSFVQQLMGGETKILVFACAPSGIWLRASDGCLFDWSDLTAPTPNRMPGQPPLCLSCMRILTCSKCQFYWQIDQNTSQETYIGDDWPSQAKKIFSTKGRRGGFFNRGLVIEKRNTMLID